MIKRLFPLFFIILALGVLLFASSEAAASPSLQGTPTPLPTPTFDIARLDRPETSDPPTQLDQGALYYWGVCLACHGDRGQGLTDAWRDSYGEEDRNCWKSDCHNNDHPEWGFLIPKDQLAPAIAGPGTLARYTNAFELHAYLLESMPWWKPGSMTTEEAWAVTNYVLKLNKAQPMGIVLSLSNGSAIPVHRSVSAPTGERPGALIFALVLVLAAVGMVLQAAPKWMNSRASPATPARPNFVHHLHPPSIPATQARFRYTLGAGGLAVFLSLVLFITGLLEMYFYIPSPEQAAISVEVITTLVPFGNLVRNLHFWSAQALVIVMVVHLLRVVLTGAYALPRRFNYLIGLGLLVLILLLDFTGYVLRWDEGIRWALVVGANLLKTIPLIGEGFYEFLVGGSEPGGATLTRFYAWHIFGLTSAVAILIGWHAFRVRRDGGIAVPPPTQRTDNVRITRFELLRREVLAMVIAGVLLLLVALVFPAPIAQPLSSTSTDISDSRAPWFFLWVQELLKYGDPFLLGVITPVLVVVILGLLPYVVPRPAQAELGRWFPRGNRLAQIVAVLVVIAIFILTILSLFQLP
jgi:quinol-cytochrome oxidoreductase complex cytochrome b subunit/mono/diheme cytochrome c family protein